MPESGKGDGRFGRVLRDPSLSDKVTNLITEAIVSGDLQPGDQLESERELADQFAVSRTVIREAVRSLVAQGLVEAQSGRGVRVSAVGGDAVSRSVNLYLRSNPSVDYTRVHEVRSGLEIQIAGLAAERATADDLSHLEEINNLLGSAKPKEEDAARLDVEFHRGLAAATQNPLFLVLLDSIGDVLLEIRRVAFANRGMTGYAQKAHELILNALKTHDVDAARNAMRTHLEESERVWVDALKPARRRRPSRR